MSRAVWPLRDGRPIIEVDVQTPDGRTLQRTLLADTGAGTVKSPFDLVLEEDDCLRYGTRPDRQTTLRGAYRGTYSIYLIRIQIATLAVDRVCTAVGVQAPPPDLNGIACFRFLNSFTYGNFGDPHRFGLEIP